MRCSHLRICPADKLDRQISSTRHAERQVFHLANVGSFSPAACALTGSADCRPTFCVGQQKIILGWICMCDLSADLLKRRPRVDRREQAHRKGRLQQLTPIRRPDNLDVILTLKTGQVNCLRVSAL